MFKGSIVALVTPFTSDNRIDCEALDRLVRWHIDAGTDGIVCLGTTGESATLGDEERLTVIQTVVKAADGAIPVIAGTGSNDTAKSVRWTAEAKALGADGVLVVFPYYNRPTLEGCRQHLQEVAHVGLPMILYHHPGRTGLSFTVDELVQLCRVPKVVGIKEASGDLEFVLELIERTPIDVFSGDDLLAFPICKAGGAGVISIVANLIPKTWKNQLEVMEIDEPTTDLCRAMVLETNPQCVKYALSLLGKASPRLRLPLIEPSEDVKRHIQEAVASLSLKPAIF